MLDLVGRLEALATQLPIHLLLGHLPLEQTLVEGHELHVVLYQLQCHLVVESLVPQFLILFSNARDKEKVLQAHLGAFLELAKTVVADALD